MTGDLEITATGAVEGTISVLHYGTAGALRVNAATVTSMDGSGINARLTNDAATGDLEITTTGAVMGGASGISASNAGSGTTTITTTSVTSTSGVGILTRTTAGASVTVNAGGTVSGATGMNAIETNAPTSDTTSTPADSVTIMGTVSSGNILTMTGADTVTLAAGSTTTGITIDLGEGDDTLNLASANFGTLDGGVGADTLRITGTDVTLDTLAFAGTLSRH